MYKMTDEAYAKYVQKVSANSPLLKDMLHSFIAGGLICVVGQGLLELFLWLVTERDTALALTSVSMVLLGVLLTGLGVYDKIAKYGGAGTLVPITGFANSVCSPAMEFKSEGLVAGMSAKMFIVAGPVLVWGVGTSVIYGILYFLLA